MYLSWESIQANAISFAKRWEDATSEEAQAQSFTIDFLRVFGVDDPEKIGNFEYKVSLDDGHVGYIDYFWKNKIAIEMKSFGKDLRKAYKQLKEYVVHLPNNEIPDLLMVCDFATIILYRRTTGERFSFKTKELRKHIKRFADIAGYETTRIYENQIAVNVKAAEKMAKLHDALKEYGYEGHPLEVYLVRLLFCLFADDTGIFPENSFTNYIENSKDDGSDLSLRLEQLFEILNCPDEIRKKRNLLPKNLLQFRYINGGLFKETLPLADFNGKMRQILLDCCNFDWNKISPAIFGAMFQGVMDKKTRRKFGAHYTSEENILKLIKPLFMDELWNEFEQVKATPAQLDAFHDKIASLKFLDPACGCGNFLIITYRELRLLELEVLRMKINTAQRLLDVSSMLKVNVSQFYGIEYEEFPCQIAQVGMWLMDHQMNLLVADQFGTYYVRLPLKQSATIVHDNALRIDWNKVVLTEELSYIFGNPPFVGARIMSTEQKADLRHVFGSVKNAGNLDYVCCWYKKAVDIMQKNKNITTAFVSTNSISQGEQVAILWKPFFEKGVFINFAYRTFKWNNEAKGKAAVHCVIIGFGMIEKRNKFIVDGDICSHVENINGYLVGAQNICIESRRKPLCDIPQIGIGNKPIDGGYYLFTEDGKNDFIAKEPASKEYFKKWIGSDEFINGKKRYCLWLGDCEPADLKNMPECLKRVEAVRKYRLASKSKPTRKLADKPRRFHVENMPNNNYIVIPESSSKNRRYIPIGFLSPDIFSSNLVKIIPRGTLYHFGILTSSVHNCWMRTVAGRLKSDYRYSKEIVYNNFPWPEANKRQQTKIAKLAQVVLDARKQFPGSSLADLYDPRTMPPVLLEAHQNLDRGVMRLYGYSARMTDSAIVAKLFELYQNIVMK